MKYINANEILPKQLIKELQNYVQGGYVYVPIKTDERKNWGEQSGYRLELDRRNEKIRQEYKNGVSLDILADRYYLSVSAVRKIIYKK
ncbi:CD3324 family protein [Megamonas hypermegale]|jgi:Mor family transcriptional regulator|uniref:CD3324 family protein n=1 Tax=Megamonas hypermegale TaxID=158847 RepID=UPI0025A38230|nr:CD3324 family protein [Megamonas hypermegale]MDM8142440.1 CD3324 family protein [Megamonas hypermegale]